MRRRNINPRFKKSFSISELTMDKKVTPRQTKNYHKNKSKIKGIILSKTGKKEIIHGETAVHKYVPPYLRRHTGDVDILTPSPLDDAVQAENALDKSFGGDYFYTEKGSHVGTVRVKSRMTGETVADYTKKEGKIPFNKIDGHNYVTKKYILSKSRKIMDDPFSPHRHRKDQDTINRIKIVEGKKR